MTAVRTASSLFFVALLLQCGVCSGDEGMLGVLTPQQEVGLEPRIEGQLVAVHVRIGDVIDAGELIAELDDERFRQDLAEANARLDAAHAKLEAAETRVNVAQEALQRRRTLVEQQAVSREAVLEAEEDVALAAAELNEARASVLQQAAIVDQVDTRLRNTRIMAPFDGTVAERYSNPGMTTSPGRPVVRLISNDTLRVRFAAPVERASELSVGGDLKVGIASVNIELGGTISQIGSEVDPASGMIICEAVLDVIEDWRGLPLVGQTVRVWLLPQREM